MITHVGRNCYDWLGYRFECLCRQSTARRSQIRANLLHHLRGGLNQGLQNTFGFTIEPISSSMFLAFRDFLSMKAGTVTPKEPHRKKKQNYNPCNIAYLVVVGSSNCFSGRLIYLFSLVSKSLVFLLLNSIFGNPINSILVFIWR